MTDVTPPVAVKPPPKAKAAVAVPAPPKRYLPVFILFTSVQLDPLYNSVFPVSGGAPPNTIVEACVPWVEPALPTTSLFKLPLVAQAPIG